VDDGLGDLAELEHGLVGGLLVDHVDGGQQLVLVEVGVDGQFVEAEQHPLHLLLADGVLEGVEGVLLLEVVEAGPALVVLVVPAAVGVDHVQVLLEGPGAEAVQVAVDHVQQDDFLASHSRTTRCLSLLNATYYFSNDCSWAPSLLDSCLLKCS